MENLNQFKNQDTGEYISYAWPGGYPVCYLDKQGNIICPTCANREVDQSQEVVAGFINWEDENCVCDDCGKKIQSAYGE